MCDILMSIEPDKVYAQPDCTLPGNDNNDTFDDNNSDDTKFIRALINLIDRELVATISWAKMMPG